MSTYETMMLVRHLAQNATLFFCVGGVLFFGSIVLQYCGVLSYNNARRAGLLGMLVVFVCAWTIQHSDPAIWLINI